jgi:two-component system nitrate/nitrite response regulator NarL
VSKPQLSLALVDDHPLFTRGLELLLPAVSGGRVRVVATTTDAAAAAGLVRRHLPDIALVDLGMPPPGGIRAIAAIRRVEPGCRILAMSGLADDETALEALRNGAEGYLPKTAEPEDLVAPLLAAVEGWSVLPAQLLRALLDAHRPATSSAVLGSLTTDERALWRVIARGGTTMDVAETMHVSERTAKRLVAALLRRLKVTSRAEAAALAGRVGLLDERHDGSAG